MMMLGILADHCYALDEIELAKSVLTPLLEAPDTMHRAELLRLEGVLHLRRFAPDTDSAERSFRAAIDVASEQGAKSFELRAATSLASLWHEQGKSSEAHELLGGVYGWFTEGFDTPDLLHAKALLDDWASG